MSNKVTLWQSCTDSVNGSHWSPVVSKATLQQCLQYANKVSPYLCGTMFRVSKKGDPFGVPLITL